MRLPDLVYGVESSRAELRGVDLGAIATATVEPRVGDSPFPVRGALATGSGAARGRRRARTTSGWAPGQPLECWARGALLCAHHDRLAPHPSRLPPDRHCRRSGRGFASRASPNRSTSLWLALSPRRIRLWPPDGRHDRVAGLVDASLLEVDEQCRAADEPDQAPISANTPPGRR